MQKRFKIIREQILQLPEVEEKEAQKSGITYRTTKSFVHFDFRPTWVQVLLRDPEYSSDKNKLVKDVTSNRWGYKGSFKFTPETDTDYLFQLIKDSHESTM